MWWLGSLTTGNTVIGHQAIGIYELQNDTAIYAYVATVPEPSTNWLAVGSVGLASALWARRRRRRDSYSISACQFCKNQSQH